MSYTEPEDAILAPEVEPIPASAQPDLGDVLAAKAAAYVVADAEAAAEALNPTRSLDDQRHVENLKAQAATKSDDPAEQQAWLDDKLTAYLKTPLAEFVKIRDAMYNRMDRLESKLDKYLGLIPNDLKQEVEHNLNNAEAASSALKSVVAGVQSITVELIQSAARAQKKLKYAEQTGSELTVVEPTSADSAAVNSDENQPDSAPRFAKTWEPKKKDEPAVG